MENYGFFAATKKDADWVSLLPSSDVEIDEGNLLLFFEVMFERQEIWFKRNVLKEQRPWTTNEILRDYKYTNVYRELDKHSQWEINNILLNKNLSRLDLLWQIMLFRYFNNPNTFEYINLSTDGRWENGLPKYNEYNKEEFETYIGELRIAGENPFTNAYLINSMACPGKKRDWCYCNVVIPTLHEKIPELSELMLKAKEPEEIIKFITKLPAAANFIAHEFYISFCYTEFYSHIQLMPKFDQNSWTNVGPGASLGIRLIFPSLKPNQQKEGIYMLRDIAEDYLAKFGVFKYVKWDKKKKDYVLCDNNITLHQIEMWLCEFSKYWKMRIGKGKQRSKFVPS